MANYKINGIEHAKASVEDVPCTFIKEKLQKVVTVYTGLHLGNDSNGSKIRFYESKGGNVVNLCV